MIPFFKETVSSIDRTFNPGCEKDNNVFFCAMKRLFMFRGRAEPGVTEPELSVGIQ